MYARGILFGKLKYELGDHSYVRCPENGLSADIDFKVKGYFSGTYNAIGGVIRNDRTGEVLYDLSGMWNGEMVAKNTIVSLKPPQDDGSAVTNLQRLAGRLYSLMLPQKSTRLLRCDPLRNKRSGNHKSFG